MKSKITWQNGQDLGRSKVSDNVLTVIKYANGKCVQYYLNWSRERAEVHFEDYMNRRAPIEIELEGWEATAYEVAFGSEGTAWAGDNSTLIEAQRRIMAAMTSGDQAEMDRLMKMI